MAITRRDEAALLASTAERLLREARAQRHGEAIDLAERAAGDACTACELLGLASTLDRRSGGNSEAWAARSRAKRLVKTAEADLAAVRKILELLPPSPMPSRKPTPLYDEAAREKAEAAGREEREALTAEATEFGRPLTEPEAAILQRLGAAVLNIATPVMDGMGAKRPLDDAGVTMCRAYDIAAREARQAGLLQEPGVAVETEGRAATSVFITAVNEVAAIADAVRWTARPSASETSTGLAGSARLTAACRTIDARVGTTMEA